MTGVPGTLHTRGHLLKRFENCIHVACVFEVSVQTSRTRGLFMSHCIFFFFSTTVQVISSECLSVLLLAQMSSALTASRQYNTIQYSTIQYNITLLPSVNTLIARGMFCGAKVNHYTFTLIIKHLITTKGNKHPSKRSFIERNTRKSHWHQAVHIT